MQTKFGPYSPSRLKTAECPLRFKVSYVDRAGPKYESLPQARGSAIHEVLENITRWTITDIPVTKQAIQTACAEALQRHPVAMAEADDVVAAAHAYSRNIPPVITKERVIGVEYKIALDGHFKEVPFSVIPGKMDPHPDALVRFVADILTGSYDEKEIYIIDHKTQRNIDRHGDTFQMGFYAWGCSKLFPWAEKIYTALHFCRAELNTYSKPYLWSKEELSQIEDSVMTRIQAIEGTTTWRPVANSDCQYCPLVMDCPLLREMGLYTQSTGAITKLAHDTAQLGNTSSARELAGLVFQQETQRDFMINSLKDYVKEHGAVAIPGKIYDFHVDEKPNWNYNKPMLFNLLRDKGVDPFNYFKADTTELNKVLKRALKQDTTLSDELSALAPPVKNTKWGAK